MSYRLEDLKVYNLSEQFGNEVWFIVAKWEFLAKETVGKQLVRSAGKLSAKTNN